MSSNKNDDDDTNHYNDGGGVIIVIILIITFISIFMTNVKFFFLFHSEDPVLFAFNRALCLLVKNDALNNALNIFLITIMTNCMN